MNILFKLIFFRNLVLLLLIASPFILIGYLFFSKGPADFGAVNFAQTQIEAKYGPIIKSQEVQVISYTPKSAEDKKDGTYKLHFGHDNHHGYVECEYDSRSGKFQLLSINQE
jgi:hypothetical protein